MQQKKSPVAPIFLALSPRQNEKIEIKSDRKKYVHSSHRSESENEKQKDCKHITRSDQTHSEATSMEKKIFVQIFSSIKLNVESFSQENLHIELYLALYDCHAFFMIARNSFEAWNLHH